MEIGARLHHIQLLSAAPRACADFYGRIYGMDVCETPAGFICAGPQRRIMFIEGLANQLGFAAYAFDNAGDFERYRQQVGIQAQRADVESPMFAGPAFKVEDPDGNVMLFGMPDSAAQRAPERQGAVPPARLQHLGIRSSDPLAMLRFYRDTLGFIVSDCVYTDAGELRACFLRTDREHHALAIFHASEARHDHLSFETTDWMALQVWADRVSALESPIVWGIGRHGPGNDVFFMVRDPDGNLAEVSTELEICSPARDEGRWRHEERTLNLWGSAIMRS